MRMVGWNHHCSAGVSCAVFACEGFKSPQEIADVARSVYV